MSETETVTVPMTAKRAAWSQRPSCSPLPSCSSVLGHCRSPPSNQQFCTASAALGMSPAAETVSYETPAVSIQ